MGPVRCSWADAPRTSRRATRRLRLSGVHLEHRQQGIDRLVDVARLTDKGIVLAESLVADLRGRKILLPPAGVIERVCAEALTRANRRIYNTLAGSLNDGHRERLDGLLERKDNGPHTWLAWLRLPPGKPNSRHVLVHIDRLEKLRALRLPDGVDRLVHQNRLLKIAREGAQMTAADLAKFETQRRYATMVALVVEATATVTDEIIDLHDRVIIRLMALAKTKHQEQFHKSGKAVNDSLKLFGEVGRALVNAKHDEIIPTAATEALWQSIGKQPELIWLEAGHISAAKFLPGEMVRLQKFFNDWKPR